MEKRKALEISTINTSSGSLYYWYTPIYWWARESSNNNPQLDGSSKDYIPSFLYKNKNIESFIRLLVLVTTIIAHMHGNIWYAH